TSYGGYSLFYALSLSLTTSITIMYLTLMGGYVLLLGSVMGAWAGASNRVEAFNLHIGALTPAGFLYLSLAVVSLVESSRTNHRIKESWDLLDVGGLSLVEVQTRVKTMLVLSGVLSAVTTIMVAGVALVSLKSRGVLLDMGCVRQRVRLTRSEGWAMTWAFVMAALSVLFDGGYILFSGWLADNEEAVWLTGLWRAIGRGDPRYVQGDGFVLATGIAVALVLGPACLLYAWTIFCRRGFRFPVGILVCVAVVYTQLLSYATWRWPEGWSGGGVSFWVVFVLWGLLRVVAPVAILWYNIKHLSKRVHAAEVH
ncbi:unnamed protein product, partial [Choristocarpus tenellus]